MNSETVLFFCCCFDFRLINIKKNKKYSNSNDHQLFFKYMYGIYILFVCKQFACIVCSTTE